MNADDNAPPCVRPAFLVVAAGRYCRHRLGPWPAVAGGAVCLAVAGRDGALWPAAGAGLWPAPADGISGCGLGSICRAGTRDCGVVSVRGPARPRGDRGLCYGHQRAGLDTVRILAPRTTWRTAKPPCAVRAVPHGLPVSEGAVPVPADDHLAGQGVIGLRCANLRASFC